MSKVEVPMNFPEVNNEVRSSHAKREECIILITIERRRRGINENALNV